MAVIVIVAVGISAAAHMANTVVMTKSVTLAMVGDSLLATLIIVS